MHGVYLCTYLVNRLFCFISVLYHHCETQEIHLHVIHCVQRLWNLDQGTTQQDALNIIIVISWGEGNHVNLNVAIKLPFLGKMLRFWWKRHCCFLDVLNMNNLAHKESFLTSQYCQQCSEFQPFQGPSS